MKLEVVPIPVTDVDRAKAFYVEKVGFNADHDARVDEKIRFVQLTPPGSACSIVLGEGIVEMAPGTQKGVMMVIESAEETLVDLRSRGVETSEIIDMDWGRFIYFSDPDGNSWALQELPDYAAAKQAQS
ncbi:putative enzyme related to lactoylglutathione lyase [Psychromicrobium silvestre]|uniref:Putative enzyme related to lactoylglutathione lyase n=1 Tax=Psychromicrobium silvestre TaxID=1645614 RepID=A0A7Y9LTR2_9MICC|nr:glyoxalase superfamily protein [Psychromicrobium silvestre]NYE95355.1 putative enzyme related to lactoylglutathione lyase [Psychromicrobium silvestre]